MSVSSTQIIEETPKQIVKRTKSRELTGKCLRVEQHEVESKTSEDPTIALFAQWAKEDTNMTPEEQRKNRTLYARIEKNGISRTTI